MSILITNCRIFDGESPKLIEGMSVLIEGNKISRIEPDLPAPDGATTLDARGKTLIPGLIDVHWHSMFCFWPVSSVMNSDLGSLSIHAAKAAGQTLMRGFTTVRDIGGNVFPIAQATDAGVIDGPRVYPSGGFITQTSGHADFRGPLVVPSNDGTPLDYVQRTGHFLIADGVPEVIKRTREVLRMGATQIKTMAGGGVTSLYDPLDVSEFTFEELKAIVDVAKTWNTYVAAHIFTDDAIQVAIKAGIKSIEHGNLIQKKETLQMMRDSDVWLSAQPILNDEDALKFEDPRSTKKFLTVTDGTDRNYTLAKEMGVKIAFGTDCLFDPESMVRQGKMLAKLTRWFSPYEALKMATHDNAQLLKLCGPRDPYPGELGVVKVGALADLILVEGNPLENLDLVADAAKNFDMIMKDGKVYKNTLS